MLLYCGGDHHVAGAEAVNNHVTASSDPMWSHLGPLPHPDNAIVCWPRKLSDLLKFSLTLGKTSNSIKEISKDVVEWVDAMHSKGREDLFVIIGWDITSPTDHNRVHSLHQTLQSKKVPHLFFNTDKAFFRVAKHYDWKGSYLEPYNKANSYVSTLRSQKFLTVTPSSPYFGKEAHSFWAVYLLQYIMKTKLVTL